MIKENKFVFLLYTREVFAGFNVSFMKYVLFWSVFLVLFYMLLWWLIRRTPVTGDDEKEVSRISRLLKRLGDKWGVK